MAEPRGENQRPCRWCQAAYGLDAELCEFAHHQPAVVVAPLALAMARMFQTRNPSDEQVGWFMEDASAVVEDFDPLPDEWRPRPPCSTSSGGWTAGTCRSPTSTAPTRP